MAFAIGNVLPQVGDLPVPGGNLFAQAGHHGGDEQLLTITAWVAYRAAARSGGKDSQAQDLLFLPS